MTNEINLKECRKAIEDVRNDRLKMQRMMNQLTDYKAKDEVAESVNIQVAVLYAKRMQVAITDLVQMEEILTQSLSNMIEEDGKDV